jgi:hypothetical protein
MRKLPHLSAHVFPSQRLKTLSVTLPNGVIPQGVCIPEAAIENLTGHHNQKYFNLWSNLLNNYYPYIAAKYEPEFAKYGYSLSIGFSISEEWPQQVGKFSPVVGALYSLTSNASAFVVRLATRSKGYVKRQIRARLPEP